MTPKIKIQRRIKNQIGDTGIYWYHVTIDGLTIAENYEKICNKLNAIVRIAQKLDDKSFLEITRNCLDIEKILYELLELNELEDKP